MTILPELKLELSRAAQRLEPAPPRRRWFRLGRRTLVLIPIVIVALGGLAYAATQVVNSDHGHPFAINQYRYGACPTAVLPLEADSLAQARRAAVEQAAIAYPHRKLRGAYAVDAHVVTKGSVRSVDAEKCGLLGKTVLVDLHLPAPFNSASMSEGAVYVSRIREAGGGASYQVWGLEH
jgi:hypothetical protein